MAGSQETLTRRQKVEERERAILSAAREAFRELGYDGARMSDIARRAGVAEGTIYLYYKTKSELMRALVADFWDDLTRSARKAVTASDDTFAALRQLASFHLLTLIDRFDIVALTQSGRADEQDLRETQGFMRTYVAVFDEIWRRGVDRGDLKDETELWIIRDLFFGPLEYSTRTIRLHPDRSSEEVVDHLIESLKLQHGRMQEPKRVSTHEDALMARLERAVETLERQTKS